MYKITTDKLLKVVNVINRADRAINNLERLGRNQIIYPELKKEMQLICDELKSQYSLNEYTDPNARNSELEKLKNG